jgi:hypothetical protein
MYLAVGVGAIGSLIDYEFMTIAGSPLDQHVCKYKVVYRTYNYSEVGGKKSTVSSVYQHVVEQWRDVIFWSSNDCVDGSVFLLFFLVDYTPNSYNEVFYEWPGTYITNIHYNIEKVRPIHRSLEVYWNIVCTADILG